MSVIYLLLSAIKIVHVHWLEDVSPTIESQNNLGWKGLTKVI